jgi:hypothetical protein
MNRTTKALLHNEKRDDAGVLATKAWLPIALCKVASKEVGKVAA